MLRILLTKYNYEKNKEKFLIKVFYSKILLIELILMLFPIILKIKE
jgi:hypothetical protein